MATNLLASKNKHDTVVGTLVALEGEGAIAVLEWSSHKLKVPAKSPFDQSLNKNVTE